MFLAHVLMRRSMLTHCILRLVGWNPSYVFEPSCQMEASRSEKRCTYFFWFVSWFLVKMQRTKGWWDFVNHQGRHWILLWHCQDPASWPQQRQLHHREFNSCIPDAPSTPKPRHEQGLATVCVHIFLVHGCAKTGNQWFICLIDISWYFPCIHMYSHVFTCLHIWFLSRRCPISENMPFNFMGWM